MRIWIEHDDYPGRMLEVDPDYVMQLFDPNGLTFRQVVDTYAYELTDGRRLRSLRRAEQDGRRIAELEWL